MLRFTLNVTGTRFSDIHVTMRAKYVPCGKIYDDYYMQRGHSGLAYFKGIPIQKGYGLGGIIAGIARSAIPLFKKAVLPTLGKVGKSMMKRGIPMAKKGARYALQEGLSGIEDILTKKKTPKQAVRERSGHVSKRIAEMVQEELVKPAKRKKRKPRGDTFVDIFSN